MRISIFFLFQISMLPGDCVDHQLHLPTHLSQWSYKAVLAKARSCKECGAAARVSSWTVKRTPSASVTGEEDDFGAIEPLHAMVSLTET